jgi:polyphosphate kinase
MTIPFLNRELSWIEFNQRVLYEAQRSDVPLLERVKFLAITASNLDEFFQVRIGGLILLKRTGRKGTDPSGLTPTQQLEVLRKRMSLFVEDQYRLLHGTLMPLLAKQGIEFLEPARLTESEKTTLRAIFEHSILPVLTPLAYEAGEEAPILPALTPILACSITDPATAVQRHAFIPLPDSLGRHIALTNKPNTLILIEDLVALHASSLFPGENVTASGVFRLTRNGDISVDENNINDLADEMEDVLTARRFADTVRIEIPISCPRELLAIIRSATSAERRDTYTIPRGPVGLASLMELTQLADFDHLRNEEWSPQPSPDIAPGASLFESIAQRDLLLFHPYQSFDPVMKLLEESAADPQVLAIKQVLYRTAKKSSIIDALIRAAQNGKQVTVLVELKARFDEARNLMRADELQNAGVNIVYGVKGLKTHAKICMVVRREEGQLRRYVHLGTGNYNETTARLYTDISYLTCRPEFGNDASLFFNALTGRSKLLRFRHLVPAPTQMKQRLLELIASEADRARLGEPAQIMAKVNSLQDPDVISALYEASQAGVQIQLNIRGVCCLKPGDKKFSKNIKVVSIIDRYLEHARIFSFHQGGEPAVFIASADWMSRNLERRIELMIPIDEPALRRRLVNILKSCMADNCNAHEILPDGSSTLIKPAKGQKTFRAQLHFYREAKRLAKAMEHERSLTFEPHTPGAR